MHRMNWLIGSVFLAMVWALFTTCAFTKPANQGPPPAPFQETISALAVDLLDRIKADRPASTGKDATDVMLIPFTDAVTDEVPRISRKIENIFISEGSRKFKDFVLARLTSKNFRQADYLINGTIRMDTYRDPDAETARKCYRVYGEAMRLKDKTVIARSRRWIADLNIDYRLTPIYRDSPLYLRGSHLSAASETLEQRPDQPDSDMSLETRAILTEARMAYENGRYEAAADLFARAAERKDGQDLDTYAGLYLVNYQLGRLHAAETAFVRLVAISAEKYRRFTVKYLFGVNSVQFLKDKNLEERYQTWIRNIGKYFHQSDMCLQIVGHSSRTGSTPSFPWNGPKAFRRFYKKLFRKCCSDLM